MKPRLGLCTFSCHQQWQALQKIKPGAQPPFTNGPTFLDYVVRNLGGQGVQTGVKTADEARAIRERVESTGSYYEGDIRLPKDEADLATFESSLKLIREAGGTVARSVLLWTRRYETFHSMADVRAFREHGHKVLSLFEPLLKKHGVRLALENHKDQLVFEQLDMLKHFSSEWIGVCVDTGNNLALLEEPHGVVESLAPFAASVHLKDMALQPSPQGFRLSEVPLGTGFLDLPRMIATLRAANPGIAFNLEMATRDPLSIPCLTPEYWRVFDQRPAHDLWRALALVQAHPPRQQPPSVTGKPFADVLAEEETHNRESLAWMHKHIV